MYSADHQLPPLAEEGAKAFGTPVYTPLMSCDHPTKHRSILPIVRASSIPGNAA